VRAGAAERLYARLDALLTTKGWLRKKPRGKKMPAHIAQQCPPEPAGGRGSSTSSPLTSEVPPRARTPCLAVRIVRAWVKIGLANLAYNFTQFRWLQGRTAPA